VRLGQNETMSSCLRCDRNQVKKACTCGKRRKYTSRKVSSSLMHSTGGRQSSHGMTGEAAGESDTVALQRAASQPGQTVISFNGQWQKRSTAASVALGKAPTSPESQQPRLDSAPPQQCVRNSTIITFWPSIIIKHPFFSFLFRIYTYVSWMLATERPWRRPRRHLWP